MKRLLLLFLLSVSEHVNAQERLPINYNTLANFDFENQLKLDYNSKPGKYFDSSTHQHNRQRITYLSQINDRDSSKEAARLIRNLWYNMPGTYRLEDFETEIESINLFRINDLQSISGFWKSKYNIHPLTGEPFKNDKILLLTDSTVSVYIGGKLVRFTSYHLHIEKQKDEIWWNYFMIFTDTNSKLKIDISPTKSKNPAGLTEEIKYLTFSGNCPGEIYTNDFFDANLL